MPRQSLLELFAADSRPHTEVAFVWQRGYRTIRWTYSDVSSRANQFARELEARHIAKGDRVLLWGSNSGEWVAALLGCTLAMASTETHSEFRICRSII